MLLKLASPLSVVVVMAMVGEVVVVVIVVSLQPAVFHELWCQVYETAVAE